jgi:hypothetical protein
MSATATTKPESDVVVIQDSFDIIIPASLLTESTTTGECSILVQIEPQDATLLDFEGASGAIGRFESDENGSAYLTSEACICCLSCSSFYIAVAVVVPTNKTHHTFAHAINDSHFRLEGLPIRRNDSPRTYRHDLDITRRRNEGRCHYR